MNSHESALELIGDIRALFAGEAEAPLVTDDPAEAGPQLAAGGSVLVLGPPVTSFPTFGHDEHEWTLLAVAGTAHDPRAAWTALAALVETLREPLGLTLARPAEFTGDGTAGALAAYLLTFTTTTEH